MKGAAITARDPVSGWYFAETPMSQQRNQDTPASREQCTRQHSRTWLGDQT